MFCIRSYNHLKIVGLCHFQLNLHFQGDWLGSDSYLWATAMPFCRLFCGIKWSILAKTESKYLYRVQSYEARYVFFGLSHFHANLRFQGDCLGFGSYPRGRNLPFCRDLCGIKWSVLVETESKYLYPVQSYKPRSVCWTLSFSHKPPFWRLLPWVR